MTSLHERRIEIADVTKDGIEFRCVDDLDLWKVVWATFTAQEARELAQELLEAADDLDEILGAG